MSTTVPPSAAPVPNGNAGRVVRFLATRAGLSLITLWLLSMIVFAGGQLLPGDIGRAVLGPENVVEHDIVMWAEDMSFMQNERPGAYFIVGSRGGLDTSFPHHNARFDIDERALDVGYRMMVALGLRG